MVLWMSLVSLAAEIGEPAPEFSLTAIDGTRHTLSQYRGKVVVIEWTNPGCPYVVDTHSPGGALDGLAAKEVAAGVVWLAINSSAPGKQGHGLDTNRQAAETWNLSHPILLDESGALGGRTARSPRPTCTLSTHKGSSCTKVRSTISRCGGGMASR